MAKKRSKSSRTAPRRNGNRHGIYDDVVALASSLMRSRKDYGADKLDSLAEATREFAAALPEMPTLRVYVNSAAERLDELSGYMMNTEFDDMFEDAGEFARRHPMATFGIAIAAGVGAARLIHMPSTLASYGRARKPRRGMSTHG